MTQTETHADLSRRLAAGADDAPAILAPDRATLSHGELRSLIADTAKQLHARG
ncbi:AMP-dependent synthetase, partial [Mesorhizobium sp. M7A.T.Ca.TU.009.01.3.2]